MKTRLHLEERPAILAEQGTHEQDLARLIIAALQENIPAASRTLLKEFLAQIAENQERIAEFKSAHE